MDRLTIYIEFARIMVERDRRLLGAIRGWAATHPPETSLNSPARSPARDRMFEEAQGLVGEIDRLKKKVAERSTAAAVKLGSIYADFDDRVTKAEGRLAKGLDERALDVESQLQELTNLGEQITAASSDDSGKSLLQDAVRQPVQEDSPPPSAASFRDAG
jgi:hypothetical protein